VYFTIAPTSQEPTSRRERASETDGPATPAPPGVRRRLLPPHLAIAYRGATAHTDDAVICKHGGRESLGLRCCAVLYTECRATGSSWVQGLSERVRSVPPPPRHSGAVLRTPHTLARALSVHTPARARAHVSLAAMKPRDLQAVSVRDCILVCDCILVGSGCRAAGR
jgi:hypothetical protein